MGCKFKLMIMPKNAKKNLFFIFLLFLYTYSFAQDNINIYITDTELKIKRKYRNALKVNVEINVPNLQDSLILYRFNQYVHSSGFIIHDFSKPFEAFTGYSGLLYVIEDENNNVIEPFGEALVSFKYFEDEIEDANRRRIERAVVLSNLKIENKLFYTFELSDYDLAKYEIVSEKQSLVLYPLYGKYHRLPKGEYYLYFVYFYSSSIRNIVSNKVKLVVK